MGIYIKGVNMPNCCQECPCFYISRGDGEYTFDTNGCSALHVQFNKYVYYGKHIHNPWKGIYKDCPLIEIKEPLENEDMRIIFDAGYASGRFDELGKERPTGKWIYRSIGDTVWRVCSCCGWEQRYDYPRFMGHHYLYCPHCGALTEGAKDEADKSQSE